MQKQSENLGDLLTKLKAAMLMAVAPTRPATYRKPVSAIYLQCMLYCNLTCAKFKFTTWNLKWDAGRQRQPQLATSLPSGTYATFATMA